MSGIVESINEFLQGLYNAFIPSQRYVTFLEGLRTTILISFFAIILGVAIGIVVAVIKVLSTNSKKSHGFLGLLGRVPNKICSIYIGVIRGTPVLVQLMIISNMIFTSRGTNLIFVAVVCFGINSGAYVAEIIRAGIMSIDRGQMEAGRSLGLNQVQTMYLIILPQAIKNILPALCNEFIVLVKETSVASFIAVTEITQGAKYIGSSTYNYLPPYVIAGIFYLVINLILTKFVSLFERRLAKSDSH